LVRHWPQVQRTVPFWLKTMVPEILAGKRVLVVAHGTSLRGLVKHIKDVVSGRDETGAVFRNPVWPNLFKTFC
jgi:broad specificity phosphatase PhoE